MRCGPIGVVVAVVLVVACTPSGEDRSDPDRYLLADGEPCGVMIGDISPHPWLGIHEIAEVSLPDGRIRASRGWPFGDRGEEAAAVRIGDVEVDIWPRPGGASASWVQAGSGTSVHADGVDVEEMADLVEVLVAVEGLAELAEVVVDHIDGASVAYAGPPPRYDVGVVYDDTALFGAGVPIDERAVDLLYSQMPEAQQGEDGAWTYSEAGVPVVADRRTLAPQDVVAEVDEVDPDGFARVLDGLAGGPVRLLTTGQLALAGTPSCEELESIDDHPELATPEDVSSVESRSTPDGWSVEVALEDLGQMHDAPSLVVLEIGPQVWFVARLPEASAAEPRPIDSVAFSGLTEVEAEIVVEALTPR